MRGPTRDGSREPCPGPPGSLAPRGAAVLFALACAAAGLLVAGCPARHDGGPVTVVVTDEKSGAAGMNPEDIEKAARVEGELVWYTSTPEKEATAFLAAFQRKYPFLRPRLYRSGTFETVQKMEEEIKSGDVHADVLHVLDVGIFIDLRRRGELLAYAPPEEADIGDQFEEPGYWWAMRLVDIAMAYNSSKLPSERAPRTWQDLLRPEFKGQLGFKDAGTAGTAYAEYYLLRERFGTYFWEQIAAQNPRIYRSSAAVMDDLAEGRVLIAGEMPGYAIYSAAREGKPIVGVWPKEGVPFIPGPIAILSRSPHPNAAKLFVNFALSHDGQALCRQLTGAYSARRDVGPLAGQPPLSAFHLLTPTAGWDDYFQKQERLRNELAGFFRTGTE